MKEEGLDNATIRVMDHTVAVLLVYPDALVSNSGELTLGPKFEEGLYKALGALHRVLLSSDADIRFYVLVVSDPKIPGAYLTLVRYVDDIRRASANMLSTPEIFARTVFELNVSPATETLTIDQYVPRDIQLEEFLSWQLARRIQSGLDALQTKGLAQIGRCTGSFQDGEFVFTLDVASSKAEGINEETLREVFRISTDVIAGVLASYHFESYQQIRLIHPPTGRTLIFPKARLAIFQ